LLAKIFFRNNKEEQARSQLTALHKAKDAGINNVPKPIALHKNILVMELIDAASLADYCEAGYSDSVNNVLAKQITEQQIIDLLKTIDSLIRLDIDVDFGGGMSNFLYAEDKGFYAIDLSMKEPNYSYPTLDELVTCEMQDFFDSIGLGSMFNTAYEKFKSQN
jgi:RIO-like serine/threonine protein kinase